MILHGFHFSEGNKKLGRVLNFNLMPIVTCNKNAPCTGLNGGEGGCYAIRDMKRYKECRKSWGENTDLLMNKHEYSLFVESFCEAINIFNCNLVRLHSDGDIFSVEYLDALCKVAKKNRSVKFMTYTKQYDIISEYLKMGNTIPKNFKIYLSAWNSFKPSEELENDFQIAYYNDFNHSNLIKWEDSFTCPGSCPQCKYKCWKTKKNIIFNKH